MDKQIVDAICGLVALIYWIGWIFLIIFSYPGISLCVAIGGYFAWKYFRKEKSESKVNPVSLPSAKKYQPAPPKVVKPPPNPYTLEELQRHLDNYRRKALQSGKLDKWKYGRDYERYIGYLFEKHGCKVIYNGAIEGSSDGGIDLICYIDDKCYLIQCKRWKNLVSAEYIWNFKDAVERFKLYNVEPCKVIGVFYTTSKYTQEARAVAKKYKIQCHVMSFDSISEYPPVKCLSRNGEKVYYLPFDKEFDRISVEKGCTYKFTVADAEKSGYRYHLNYDVLLAA